jgi:hypothetical protein
VKYFSITIRYDRFINKVLCGEIKLDILRKYELPKDRKELEDNDRKSIAKGSMGIGDEFLVEVIDIVEEAFKRHRLVYKNQYVWPAEGRCICVELMVNKKHETYHWSSGDYHIWTKAEDRDAFDAVRLELEVDGINLHISPELDEFELNEDPHKCKDHDEMFKTVKEYIDEVDDGR